MSARPEVGASWAGYRIEEEIGAGGFGRVYLAHDPDLDRRVALKVLHADRVDDDARERFLRESKVAASLAHPRIIPIHRAGEHEGVPFIVMRYVDGGDLRGVLRRGPLGARRTVDVISQIASALDRAHRDGLVHRDVKPANILVTADSDDVYLADFGVTRAVDGTTTGVPPATPHYAAPEFLRGLTAGPAADQYSLACTAFECLTGRVPYPGRVALEVASQHVTAEVPTVSSLRPDLPTGVDVVVARAMAKAVGDRHPSCGAFADALRDTIANAPSSIAASPRWSGPADPASTPTVRPGKSVFDEPAAEFAPSVAEVSGADVFAPPGVSEPAASDATHPVDVVAETMSIPETSPPRAESDALPPPFATPARSPWPRIAIAVVVVAALGLVGALVLRAVAADSDRTATATTTTTSTTEALPAVVPTAEAVAALVPPWLEGCVPPAEAPADDVVQLVCPRDEVPQLVTFTLFPDTASRDQAFDDTASTLEISAATSGECALARSGVHDYRGEVSSGRVGCRIAGSRTDLAWTSTDAPLLVTAGGNGFYGAHYGFFVDVVGRIDGAFPLPVEQDLLDDLPGDLLVDCARDIDLADQAPGLAAAVCRPGGDVAVVSWVRFRGDDPMTTWIVSRSSVVDERLDRSEDACSPEGFGDPIAQEPDDDDADADDDDDTDPPAPVFPTAGLTRYDRDGTTGDVLCFENSSGQDVLFWTRDGSLIGSIAVASADATMDDLLRWWENGGHRP